MRKFIPNNGRLLIKAVEAAPVSASGLILIPDSAKTETTEGIVVASGVLEFEVGSTVLFGKYAGQKLTIDGQEYRIMKAEEVFGGFESESEQLALPLGLA